MKKLRGTLNYQLKPSDMETPQGVSLTVPDDSYTIQELLAKHEQGLALGIQHLGQFDLDNDEEFEGIDMNQFQQLEETEKREIMSETAEVRHKVTKAEKARIQREKEEKEAKAKEANT